MRKVSIIIPCYNAEKYVAEAIQSALDQAHPNCEVIVIDDGSTDGSLDVIKSFGDRICWKTGPNRGGCAARNQGLLLASGDYIQFLDADDRLVPRKIKAQVIALESAPPHSIACCPWRYFDATHKQPPSPRLFWKSYARGVDLLTDMWLDGGFFSPACWLVPNSLLKKVGNWNQNLSCDQDGEYFGRVLLQTREVVFIDFVCCEYRMPQNANVSRSVSENALWSKAEAIRIVSSGLEAKCNTGKVVAAIRKRWIGFAVFCSECSRKWMNIALESLQSSPVPIEHPDRLYGVFLRSLASVFGIANAIRIRSRIKRPFGLAS